MTNNSFSLESKYLRRSVLVHMMETSHAPLHDCITIFFNDGQDFRALDMQENMKQFEGSYPNLPLRIFGLVAGDRINEYGCVYKNDYKNRGSKAGLYSQFIAEEFIPYLYNAQGLILNRTYTGFAGFSLGGLSAMDIVIHNRDLFGFCGVFSGSFWWRYREYSDNDPDGARILHEYIDTHTIPADQRFWFQAGTHDEDCDRNGNGIIDSIDDTLDIMTSLEKKGYRRGKNMEYLEVKYGTHDPRTWGTVMPQFFDWIINGLKDTLSCKRKTA